MLGPRLRPYENGYIASSISPGYQRLQELARAAGVSRAFTLSVKLDLYTILRDTKEKEGVDGLTAAEIADRLGLKTAPGLRAVRDWLDVLVSLALLNRSDTRSGVHDDHDGDGEDQDDQRRRPSADTAAASLYSNTPESNTYLAKQSSEYMGGHAVVYHDRTFPQLLFLEHSLRTGVQPPAARAVVAPLKQTFAGEAAAAGSGDVMSGPTGGDPVAFALGMAGCNKPGFKSFASQFDFSRYNTLGDIGGSAGVLCCAVAAAHPHMSCVTHDLAAIRAAAEQYIKQQQLTERIQVVDLDFFTNEPFPTYDVITMSMIMHDWGLEKKKFLMKKAYDALPPGGAFVALEVLIDDDRKQNIWGLMMSLDMLMEFEEECSFDFTFKDFTDWAIELGFSSTQLIRLTGANSAAVAYK